MTMSKSLLEKLERFLVQNSTDIVLSGTDDDPSNDADDVENLLDEMRKCVEDSNTSAISGGLILFKRDGSGGGGYFLDFDSALDNAMSSETILEFMKRLSDESSCQDSEFYFRYPHSRIMDRRSNQGQMLERMRPAALS